MGVAAVAGVLRGLVWPWRLVGSPWGLVRGPGPQDGGWRATPGAGPSMRWGVIASGPGGVVLGGSLVFPCFSVYPTLWGVGAGEQGAVED